MKKILSVLLSLTVLFGACTAAFADANFEDDGNRNQDEGLVDDELGNNGYDRPIEWQDRTDAQDAEDEKNVVAEVRDSYNILVDKLISLGIWKKIGHQYVRSVTRGELAAIIAAVVDASFSSQDETFRDVPKSNPYHAEVETLCAMGVVRGGGDGLYRPDEEATYLDALVMLVRAVGLEPLTDSLGDFPFNYLTIAGKYELTPPAKDWKPEDSFNRMDAARWVEALATAEIPENGVFETNSREVSILERFHKVFRLRGAVSSFGEKYLDGSVPAGETQARIGGLLMEAGTLDLSAWFGLRVYAYYKTEPNGDNTLLFVEDGGNTIVSLEGKQITGCSGRTFTYEDGETGRRLSETVPAGVKSIVNGFPPSHFSEDDVTGADLIRLVDNTGDGEYDVLFSEKYDVHVVSGIGEADNQVFDYYTGASVAIDFTNKNLVMTDRVGNPVEAYYIGQWSVLSVGGDSSGYQKVIVSNEQVTGTVTETSGLNENDWKAGELTVGGTVYQLSTDKAAFAGGNFPKAGESYTFYLDYLGRIAGFTRKAGSAARLGFLIKAAPDGGMGDEVKLKIVDWVNSFTVYDAAQNIRVDGQKLTGGAALMERLDAVTRSLNDRMASIDSDYVLPEEMYQGNTLYIRQPVYFSVNADGKVSELDTPLRGASEDSAKQDTFFGRGTMTLYEDFSKRASGENIKPGGLYLRNTMTFGNDSGSTISVPNDLKVFIVPVTNDFAALDNEANYDRAMIGYFDAWKNYPLNADEGAPSNRLDAYNVSEDRTCPLLVYSLTLSTGKVLDKRTPLTVVSQLGSMVNEEGDIVTMLRGFQGNREITVPVADGVAFTKQYRGANGEPVESTVRRGDIIRYETNYDGELSRYVKVFSLRDEDDPAIVKSGNEIDSALDGQSLPPTLLAVSDGKYEANGHNMPHIGAIVNDAQDAGASYDYGASYRLVYGTVLRKNGTNLVLRTKVNKGKKEDGTINWKESEEICDALSYNIVCIDEEHDRIYVPSPEEITALSNSTQEDATRVILHTEASKQRMLVLVKRGN